MSVDDIQTNQPSTALAPPVNPSTKADLQTHSYYATAYRFAEVLLIAITIALGIFWYASWKAGSLLLAWPYLQGQELVISPQSMDLGSLQPNASINRSIEFTNIGNKAITLIGSQSSCSCIAPDNYPITILPRSSHTLPLKFATSKEPGIIDLNVKIFTDCPKHTVNQITVSGLVE